MKFQINCLRSSFTDLPGLGSATCPILQAIRNRLPVGIAILGQTYQVPIFKKSFCIFFSKKKYSFLKICKKAFQKFNNRPTYTGVENLRGQLGTIPDFCRTDKISKKKFENLDMFYCFLP